MNEFESKMMLLRTLILALTYRYINLPSHAFLTMGVTCFIPTMTNTKHLTANLFSNNNNNNNDSDGDHLQQQNTCMTDKQKYKPPKFSNSFMEHMKKVRGEERRADVEEGINCTGEPSIDPSRRVQDDGLDSEYLSDYFDNR